MKRLIHVFVGPTLPARCRPQVNGVVFHGPATQGDVYRLVREEPLAIGIIDGCFERVAAVWHKEILWAMSRGVHVAGAASMGALRAAELADFGMVGVGRIFEDYVSGRLTDDDEVTLAHADASFDYRPLSEAMVNIRATLAAAESRRLLTARQREALETSVKRRFYPDRSYALVAELARDLLPASDAQRFLAWLGAPDNHVNQKQQDALALLDHLERLRQDVPGPLRVPWTFQHTEAWEQVRLELVRRDAEQARAAQERVAGRDETQDSATDAVLQEARLRKLRLELAQQAGFRPTPEDIERAVAEFCADRGIPNREALRHYLQRHAMSLEEFSRLMSEQACIRFAKFVYEQGLDRNVADTLWLAGALPEKNEEPVTRAAGAPSAGPSPKDRDLWTND